MAMMSVGVNSIPLSCPLSRSKVELKALVANLVAAADPTEPLVATLAFLHTSYGAPVLLEPEASMIISMFTSSRYSGTPKNPAAKFSAVLTIRS